ncbi:hypothetical protein B0H21DRAFT_733156 [Amylocystis lapponica]|nr:hypothetical protein B0H21DRAFT_733156 [Amylocystis lapponica]
MGINTKWRRILLNTSQNLRQNVLKGRIWGPETSASPADGATSPPLPMHVFSSALYNSSSSSVDLSADEGDVDIKALRPKRYRNGRVRGMVETFERSGSFSSGSSVDGDNGDGGERASLSRWLRDEGSVDQEPLRSPSPTDRAPMSETVPRVPVEQEEPTMQALLAASENADAHSTGSWGARAWEQMDLAPGVTVKRIVHSEVGVLVEAPQHEAMMTVVGRGSGSRKGKGSGLQKGREDRRIVTAIFSPTEAATAEPSGEKPVAEPSVSRLKSYDEGAQVDSADSHFQSGGQKDEIEVLERQLAATRALIEAFRRRLEIVEQKVAVFEAGQETERGMERANLGLSADLKGIASADAESQTDTIPDEMEGDGDVALVRENNGQHRSLLDRTSALIPAALHQMRVNNDIIPFARRWAGRPTQEDDEPSFVSDLPSYVLLVGIGVCAVVLRVVLRRVTGRGAIPGLKS